MSQNAKSLTESLKDLQCKIASVDSDWPVVLVLASSPFLSLLFHKEVKTCLTW